MNIPKKYHLLIAAIFALYSVLVIFLLDPFVFLENHIAWISYLSILGISFSLIYGLIKLVAHSFLGPLKQLLIIASFFVISILAGSFVLLVNYSLENEIFLYFSAFFILPIPPISIYILWLIYSDLLSRVVVTAERRQNIDESIDKIFRIRNDKDKILLEIPIDQIIIFEANDNYVVTYQLMDNQRVGKKMHRIYMKKIDELLNEIEVEFLRVHKSYLVNPEFIQDLKGKSQAYRIELSHLAKEVPVSRSFDVELIKKQ